MSQHYRGALSRPHRRPDRVPAGLLDGPSAPGRPFPRLRVDRQDLRGPDPARRDPGHPVGLFQQALVDRQGPALRSGRRAASSSACSIAFLPAALIGAAAARLHQGGALQSLDRLHDADRRRLRAADDRPACRSRRRRHGRDPLSALDVSQDRPHPMPRHGPRRVALGRHHRGRHADGGHKRAAAEFSFFLAMPTMAGAFAYDLLKNYKILSANDVDDHRGRLHRRLRRGARRGEDCCSTTSPATASRPSPMWRIVVGAAGLAGLIVFG